jgi:hypothetical protein
MNNVHVYVYGMLGNVTLKKRDVGFFFKHLFLAFQETDYVTFHTYVHR